MHWLQHYENLLLTGDVEKARHFKNDCIPYRLYKYRSLSKELLDNIKNETIWLCSPLKMNDPYESSINISFIGFANHLMKSNEYWEERKKIGSIAPISEEDVDRIRKSDEPYLEYFKILETEYLLSPDHKIKTDREFQRMINYMVEQQIQFLKNMVRFCSMSERNDSLLMWSHYADQHKGVCIEYDIRSSHFLSSLCFPVIYTDKVFDATEYHTDKNKAVALSLMAALYKQRDWCYEKEWRIMTPNNLISHDGNIPALKPTSIFLGSEIHNINPEKERIYRELQDIAIDRNIDLRFMQLERSEFKMNPIN